MTFATCAGQPVERVTIHVPFQGAWFADLDWLDEASDVPKSGKVTLTIGNVIFSATIDPNHTDVFGLKKTGRIIAGANGWSKHIEARPGYANDAGVKASTVAGDAARAVGEMLGSFAGGVTSLGAHYTRDSGSAARTLEDAARGATWWVDYAGVTHVGTRPSVAAAGQYTVLSYDPKSNVAVLAVDAVDAVGIGQTIMDPQRLPSVLTIRSMEISVAPNSFRITAWCGVVGETFLTQCMRSIVGRLTDQKITTTQRYRVVKMEGNRADLQWVRRSTSLTDLPDQLRVDMAPGVSGTHATLTPGCIVYVQFVDGMRDDPIVTGFEGRGNPASVPTLLELGGENGSGAARQNDTVTSPIPPMVANGTMTLPSGPVPFTAVLMAAVGLTTGSITTCSSKVKIAT